MKRERKSKRMKKIALMLMAFMFLTPLAAAEEWLEEEPLTAVSESEAEPEMEDSPDALATEAIEWNYDELIVGSTTPMEGAFYTNMWGNTTADADVRMLLHGYNLAEWDSEAGGFVLDPSVVSGVVVTQNDEGDHVYNISLYQDLLWSDGSKVTAWDYAFTWLIEAWPGMKQLGAAQPDRNYIVGMKEWMDGSADTVSGIHVINDSQLIVTISHEYLPFFYELGLLDCAPSPSGIIAPDVLIADNGMGVFLTGAQLTVEALRATLLGEDGYVSKPRITCGPYHLVSYEGEEARFELNPYYKGDSNGVKPTIESIVLRHVSNDSMISLLASGEIGLLNKCADADAVAQGIALAAEQGDFAMANYTRMGAGFLSFSCERSTVAEAEVRKAIAHCLDKDAAVRQLVGNYGLRVDGYYGIGQWMVQLLNGTMAYPVEEPKTADAAATQAYEARLAEWESLTLDEIPAWTLDTEEASRILEAAGWKESENGGAYVKGEGVRSKTINGERIPLSLRLSYPEGSAVGEALRQHFVPYLAEAGIGLELQEISFDQLIRRYYRQEEREEDILFIATNFDVLFDPSSAFEPDGSLNWTGIQDDQLYKLAADMRHTEQGDALAYCKKWLAFQKRFAETLPMIPIYSNVYFDFYPKVLQNYQITENIGWSKAVVEAFLGDAVPEPEEEDDLFLIE